MLQFIGYFNPCSIDSLKSEQNFLDDFRMYSRISRMKSIGFWLFVPDVQIVSTLAGICPIH